MNAPDERMKIFGFPDYVVCLFVGGAAVAVIWLGSQLLVLSGALGSPPRFSMKSIILLFLGGGLPVMGAQATWLGFRYGVFWGHYGVKYHESRTEEPVAFWINILLRASFIPFGLWSFVQGLIETFR